MIAVELFPSFLTTEIGNFDMHLFGYRFLAILVNIAYRIGPRGNPQNNGGDINISIPFAACVKFAFKNNLTEKIVGLCGEIGCNPEVRMNIIKEKTQELIDRFNF